MIKESDFFQVYIDITRKNEVSENGNGVFQDLFLDVIIRKDEPPYLADKQELEEAFSQGVITEAEYKLAKESAEKIIDFYNSNQDFARQKLIEYFRIVSN